jgi:hypothetical protein
LHKTTQPTSQENNMPQTIDPIKLKAAAEHLEWVCQQYPYNDDVQGLYQGLLPMIEDAKSERVLVPVEDIPFGYFYGDGKYRDYQNPDVEGAYVEFSNEMRGGLSEQAKANIELFRAMEAVGERGGNHE